MTRTRELFIRHPGNPILTADDWPYAANTVFNPGVTVMNGETILLARVETLSGVSHLTVARSPNGIDGWVVSSEPLLEGAEGVETELWGFEDPRIVWLEEPGYFAITCTAYGPAGAAVYLATTTDFRTVERRGIVKRAEDKNAALLPERVDGKWILFHRPINAYGGSRGEIHLSRSPDLHSWSTGEQVLQPRHGAWWDSLRIGIGPRDPHADWLDGAEAMDAGGRHFFGADLSVGDGSPALSRPAAVGPTRDRATLDQPS